MSEDIDESGNEMHSIIGACYSLRPVYEKHLPCLKCSCGHQYVGDTWSEAGAVYDDHLEEHGIRRST